MEMHNKTIKLDKVHNGSLQKSSEEEFFIQKQKCIDDAC